MNKYFGSHSVPENILYAESKFVSYKVRKCTCVCICNSIMTDIAYSTLELRPNLRQRKAFPGPKFGIPSNYSKTFIQYMICIETE